MNENNELKLDFTNRKEKKDSINVYSKKKVDIEKKVDIGTYSYIEEEKSKKSNPNLLSLIIRTIISSSIIYFLYSFVIKISLEHTIVFTIVLFLYLLFSHYFDPGFKKNKESYAITGNFSGRTNVTLAELKVILYPGIFISRTITDLIKLPFRF